MFCAIINGEAKPEIIIEESEHLIAFLDHRPLFRGHTLLVPKQHVQLLSDLPADRVPEFFLEAQRLERAVETGLGADGSMILINNVVSQSASWILVSSSRYCLERPSAFLWVAATLTVLMNFTSERVIRP